jgi:hypothetical protein
VRNYHQHLMAQLKRREFDELAALPAKETIAPPCATKRKFTQRRQKTKSGGVLVSVERAWLDMKSVFSFEKQSDGTILEDKVIVDD